MRTRAKFIVEGVNDSSLFPISVPVPSFTHTHTHTHSLSLSHLSWKWTWWRRHRPRSGTVCRSCRRRSRRWAVAWTADRTSSSPFRRRGCSASRSRRRGGGSKQSKTSDVGLRRSAAVTRGRLIVAISSGDAPYIERYAPVMVAQGRTRARLPTSCCDVRIRV